MKRFALFTVLALVGAVEARALTVSGTIRDAINNPIPGIRVEINHLGAAVELREAVFADANGFYTTSLAQSGDNVYLVVKWDFELKPAATYGGHVVTLVARGAGDPFVAAQTFTLKLSPTLPNVTADTTIDLNMSQVQPAGLITVAPRLNHGLDFVENNRGAVPWTMTVDIPLFMITDNKDRMIPTGVFIDQGAFDGTGSSKDVVDAYHELAHWLHYHHNGNALPPSDAACGTHTLNSEEDPGCALKEGYASYLAQRIAEANGVVDPFFRGYRDDGINTFGLPANSIWRGDEGSPTGRQGTVWENGVVVEGAVSGWLFELDNAYGFQTMFDILFTHHPQSVLGILVELSNKFGSGAPLTLAAHGMSQLHGLFFARGRFADVPFNASAPPDGAPPAPGNTKQINGFTFLRGVVDTQVQRVPEADLGLTTHLNTKDLRVGFRPATGGVMSPAVFTPHTPYVLPAVGHVDFDTRTLNASGGDGDWDLAVLHRNHYDFEDDFLPSWKDEGTFALSEDELYLKTLGTWYDKDRDPTSNTDEEGMVIVDNTAPTISNIKPQP
jgi:hypothetical protein